MRPDATPISSGSHHRQKQRGSNDGQCHRDHGDANGDDIGLEQVGGHAGAVADIVADVVGDDGRVAGVVRSGIPASTLPTRSAPTSAALVKMPPPKRAKIETSDALEREGGERGHHQPVISGTAHDVCQHVEDLQIASRARPATSRPVTAPARKATVRPFPRLVLSPMRTLARTEMFMPMNPAAPDKSRRAETACAEPSEEGIDDHCNDHADDGDGRVLAAKSSTSWIAPATSIMRWLPGEARSTCWQCENAAEQRDNAAGDRD